MADELKPQEVTQVLDLGLGDAGSSQVTPPPADHSKRVGIDLSEAASSGLAWQLAKGGANVLLEHMPQEPNLSVVAAEQQGAPAHVAGSAPVGDTNQNNLNTGFRNVFTQAPQPLIRRKISTVLQVVAAILVATAGVVGVVFYSTGEMSSLYALLGLPEIVPRPVLVQENAPTPEPQATPSPREVMQSPATVQTGPETRVWTVLRNEMGGELLPAGSSLTADQEASFKAGLHHEFNYQRYKTVLELGALRAPGTQELLREALESKKFWIRMRALIALADLGDEITEDDVKQALGDAHSELRARFFKRFEKAPCTAGCFFVARASMKHLNALGRIQLLKVIVRENSDARDSFMVAATFDDNADVRSAANELVAGLSIDPSVWQDVKSKYGLAH